MERLVPDLSIFYVSMFICMVRYFIFKCVLSGTLTKHDNMLRAMFSGRMEVLTDSDGWILIDRQNILNMNAICWLFFFVVNLSIITEKDQETVVATLWYRSWHPSKESLKNRRINKKLRNVPVIRSGKHFGSILNFLRDGSVPLPDTRRELKELLVRMD